MTFILHTRDLEKDFLNENLVFKCSSFSENGELEVPVGMVCSYQNYIKKIALHPYTPLLYLVPIPVRIAYLYDCFNEQFGKPKNNIFVFMARYIGTNNWIKWFSVKPYLDNPNEGFQMILEGSSFTPLKGGVITLEEIFRKSAI